jgi:hypothetical protein
MEGGWVERMFQASDRTVRRAERESAIGERADRRSVRLDR